MNQDRPFQFLVNEDGEPYIGKYYETYIFWISMIRASRSTKSTSGNFSFIWFAILLIVSIRLLQFPTFWVDSSCNCSFSWLGHFLNNVCLLPPEGRLDNGIIG